MYSYSMVLRVQFWSCCSIVTVIYIKLMCTRIPHRLLFEYSRNENLTPKSLFVNMKSTRTFPDQPKQSICSSGDQTPDRDDTSVSTSNSCLESPFGSSIDMAELDRMSLKLKSLSKKLNEKTRTSKRKTDGGLSKLKVVTSIALLLFAGFAFMSSQTGPRKFTVLRDMSLMFLHSAPDTHKSSLTPSLITTRTGFQFRTKIELLVAVDEYLEDPSPSSKVAETYGWPIGMWDVSQVTSFNAVFSADRNIKAREFNEDISAWDLSKARSTRRMFHKAAAFNQAINDWDLSSVTSVEEMFSAAESFNQDIGQWNVSNVENMSQMFAGAISFDQDLSGWITTSVSDMSLMFAAALSFNHSLDAWNVHHVTSFKGMFVEATSFNQDMCAWSAFMSSLEPSQTHLMFHGSSCPDSQNPTQSIACRVCSGNL